METFTFINSIGERYYDCYERDGEIFFVSEADYEEKCLGEINTSMWWKRSAKNEWTLIEN